MGQKGVQVWVVAGAQEGLERESGVRKLVWRMAVGLMRMR